ncbi:MAG: hypothetical protein ACD_19C00189G0002, partial [uncultured bacterium]
GNRKMPEQQEQQDEDQVRYRLGINMNSCIYEIMEALKSEFEVKDFADVFVMAVTLLDQVRKLKKDFPKDKIALCVLHKGKKPKNVIVLENL